jgi:EAL domain-containing protein (putative c-di-GMP-specific phosphodiesterase class I)
LAVEDETIKARIARTDLNCTGVPLFHDDVDIHQVVAALRRLLVEVHFFEITETFYVLDRLALAGFVVELALLNAELTADDFVTGLGVTNRGHFADIDFLAFVDFESDESANNFEFAIGAPF